MKLLVDSREKWTQPGSTDTHIPKWFERHDIEWEVRKLDVGDYTLPDGKVSIDRKATIDELAKNLLNRSDRARFWREVRRARETGIHLVVLCEHGHGIEKIEDVKNWNSQYSKIRGRAVMEEIYRLHIAYGIDWVFCNRRQTAKRIVELLEGTDDGDEDILRGG